MALKHFASVVTASYVYQSDKHHYVNCKQVKDLIMRYSHLRQCSKQLRLGIMTNKLTRPGLEDLPIGSDQLKHACMLAI